MFLSKLRSSLLGSAKIDTAAAKLFPKGICEPASMKILDQAKFLSKRRVAGCGTAFHGFNQLVKSKFSFMETIHTN